MRPFINYVGSKTRLKSEIRERLPSNINRYFEPFVGGGSVLFLLASERPALTHYYVNDLNYDIILIYKALQERPELLKEHLESYEEQRTRQNFKDLIIKFNEGPISDIEQAALMWYFSKRSFNSSMIHRDSKINPGYSCHKSTLNIFNRKHYNEIVDFMQKVSCSSEDYKTFLMRSKPKRGDFIFFDPPYTVPRVRDYYKNLFGSSDMKELYDLCVELDAQKIHFLVTLNDDEDLRSLFAKSFNVERITRHSYITNGRNHEAELFIRNY